MQIKLGGGMALVEYQAPRLADYLPLPEDTPTVPQPPTNGDRPRPKRGKTFSPIEEAVVRAATLEWQTSGELAEKTGQTRSTWFCAILSNLAEREWLESSRNGYRLPEWMPEWVKNNLPP